MRPAQGPGQAGPDRGLAAAHQPQDDDVPRRPATVASRSLVGRAARPVARARPPRRRRAHDEPDAATSRLGRRLNGREPQARPRPRRPGCDRRRCSAAEGRDRPASRPTGRPRRAPRPCRPGRAWPAMPASAAASRPRTPRSSEPHGKVTVTRSAAPASAVRPTRRLDAGGQEQGVRPSVGAGHAGTPRPSPRAAASTPMTRLVRLCGGAGQDGAAVAGAEIEDHPLGAGDPVGDLADVHVVVRRPMTCAHGPQSTLGSVSLPHHRAVRAAARDRRAMGSAQPGGRRGRRRPRPRAPAGPRRRAHRQHGRARAARQGHRRPGHRHDARRSCPTSSPCSRSSASATSPGRTRGRPAGRCSSARSTSTATTFRIHCHVQPGTEELARDLAFRDALRADPTLVAHYAELKTTHRRGRAHSTATSTPTRSSAGSATSTASSAWSAPPIAPPATIGLLGGGQLGRMLALAARAMGYRIAVLDPDPACPAAAARRQRHRRRLRRRRGGAAPGDRSRRRDLRAGARRRRGRRRRRRDRPGPPRAGARCW